MMGAGARETSAHPETWRFSPAIASAPILEGHPWHEKEAS